MRRSIGGRRHPEGAAEARRERPDAAQADRQANVCHASVRVAEESRRALESAREEILVRRLAEHSAEFSAEVSWGKVRCLRHGWHV
jgi:hypothetical protein